MPSSPLRVGVDTGGTFTDFLLDRGTGAPLLTHKRLSTPDDPARAVLEGLAVLLNEAGPAHVVHGSTVATNALLEGKGARTAFVTTAGFEDTLHLARQHRPDLYALAPDRTAPPVPRTRCFGVPERVNYDGRVTQALADAATAQLVDRLCEAEVDAIAVSLLHSYANPAHEQQIATALRAALPGVHVTVSHELLPELREYERAATCVVNAVVAPPMVRYLDKLAGAIGADRLRIMASSGGSLPVAAITAAPVQTVLSGPAGGVVGALARAQASGVNRIITFDMGGTSTDVALCAGGLTRTTESEIGGLPIRVPTVDIHTVGAGGGSLAWVDGGGALRVGPQSAGAAPGPACYGRQTRPFRATVTDAHVVLGHLDPAHPLGGNLRLDADAAHEAIANVAQEMGLSPEATAEGILRIAEATMARAVQRISVQKGHDPRDFTLVPFGGAGGLHACRLAALLGMRQVLVPRHPGLLSALGMLEAGPLYTFSRTLMLRIAPEDMGSLAEHAAVRDAFAALRQKADAALAAEAVVPDQQRFRYALDLRYVGQSYELTIPLENGTDPATAFARRHEALYGYAAPDRPLDLVTVRLDASAKTLPLTLPPPAPRLPGTLLPATPRLDRTALHPGDTLSGPCVVTEFSATTVVPAGWTLRMDAAGQLLLARTDVPAPSLDGPNEEAEQPMAKLSGQAPDPIELEIFRHLFASVAEEMGERLMRSAYSPNIKERRDFSCALFDADAEMIAQAAHIPVHLGSAPASVQAVLDVFPPATMQPGERFVVNDPYAGGTHLPDITVVAPVFVHGEPTPRFFVANRAHHADVGGTTPGSMPVSTTIDDEGLRIPPRRLDEATLEWICAHTRTPEERRGDLRAQTAALHLGVERLTALCAKYGAATVSHQADALQTYTERRIRKLIATVPDGRYAFTDVLDDDGHGTTDISIACTITVAGDTLEADFTASADQVTGPVNAVRAIVLSAVNYVLCGLGPADLPINGGIMRPVTVRTRSGSVVDAHYPAAVAAGNVETSQRITDVIFGALAQALPERIPAASCGSMNNLTIGGIDPRNGAAFTYYETVAGGAGAAPYTPGGDAVHTHMTNTLNTPVEVLEHAYPFGIAEYAIREGSGGDGRQAGGNGVIRRYVFPSDAEATLLTERRTHAPYGLAGGAPGAPGRNTLIDTDGTRHALPAKATCHVTAGQQIELATPGGGGHGER